MALPAALHAAAWPQGKGRGQVIDTLSLYTTDTYFGPSSGYRYRIPQLPFAKLENSVYAEYGWSDAMTIGLNTSYQYNRLDSTPSVNSNGLSDTQLFVRQMLWKGEGRVVSVQPMVKLPSPWSDDPLLPTSTQGVDAELRLLYGEGFELWGLPHFYNSEIAYRQRMSDASNEWHFDETLGLRMTPGVMLLFQAFVTVSEGGPGASGFAVVNSSDYDLAKGQFSVVTKITDALSLQIGAFDHTYGRNTGAGGGLFLSLWMDF